MKGKKCFTLSAGLDPAASGLKVQCSANWATKASLASRGGASRWEKHLFLSVAMKASFAPMLNNICGFLWWFDFKSSQHPIFSSVAILCGQSNLSFGNDTLFWGLPSKSAFERVRVLISAWPGGTPLLRTYFSRGHPCLSTKRGGRGAIFVRGARLQRPISSDLLLAKIGWAPWHPARKSGKHPGLMFAGLATARRDDRANGICASSTWLC